MSSQATRGSNYLGPEFNEFLFAPVGTDKRGGQLSVISALARLDLDAWAEAAKLTRLPRELAIDTLSALLGRAIEVPLADKETHKIAGRLVALLPGRDQLRVDIPAHVAKDKLMGGVGLVTLILGLLVALMIGVMTLLVSSVPVAPHGVPAATTATAIAPAELL